MRLQSRDTHPKVEAKQVELLRQTQPGRRVALAVRLTDMAYSLSLNNMLSKHPEWSEQECRLELARHLYGGELANKVRRHLSKVHESV